MLLRLCFRTQQTLGNDTYYCAIVEELDYLCNLCRVQVQPSFTSKELKLINNPLGYLTIQINISEV